MNPVTIWALPSEMLTLANGEIHIWRVPLDHPPVALELLSTYLSTEEITRAERFVFPHDKNHFIAGRGMLRVILGRYLGMPPRSLSIEPRVYKEFSRADNEKGHLLAQAGDQRCQRKVEMSGFLPY